MNRMQRIDRNIYSGGATEGARVILPREIYASDRDEGRVLHSATDRDGEQRKIEIDE